MDYQNRNKNNLKVLLSLLALVAVMVGLAFASVPLYNLFCKVTGYAGTTGESSQLPDEIVDRTITVRFQAETSPDLPWDFKAEQNSVDVKLGQGGLISFSAKNLSNKPVAGTAVFNVNPQKVGKYFKKIQCFCFDRQVLESGQRVDMPVYFYIDPEMDKDVFTKEVKTITLSYIFFKADSEDLDSSIAEFYNANE